MGWKDFFKNIFTFGAHGKVQKAVKSYDEHFEEFKELHAEMEQRRIEVNDVVLNVVEVKKSAVQSLNKIKKITKNLKGKEREFVFSNLSSPQIQTDFQYVQQSLTVANSVLAASKGVGTGLATSTAAYFLVGKFALASTGTAISTLSGAAATNATLAWLGGGSIAAGGGGIAMGTTMLGGLFFIPALVVMGIFSHYSANKKIKEIKEKELELLNAIDKIKQNILSLDIIEQRAIEIAQSILKGEEAFNIEFKKVYKAIYKIPFLSKFFKMIKKLFGFNYFSMKDVNEIQYLGKIATDFAVLIDTKILLDE